MTNRNPNLDNAVLLAIDMSKHRQEVLIERPEGGRRRRMAVTWHRILTHYRNQPRPHSRHRDRPPD